jgi:hypothetical protein
VVKGGVFGTAAAKHTTLLVTYSFVLTEVLNTVTFVVTSFSTRSLPFVRGLPVNCKHIQLSKHAIAKEGTSNSPTPKLGGKGQAWERTCRSKSGGENNPESEGIERKCDRKHQKSKRRECEMADV